MEPEKAVTKGLKQTTLWQCLKGNRRGQVDEDETNGQGAGELVDHLSEDGNVCPE